MAANGAAGAGASQQQQLPSDAVAVRTILKTMGVEAVEPRVSHMLLDFMYAYVSGVLCDASAFAEQRGRQPGEVEHDDVSLAVQVRGRSAFAQPPPVELLRQLADGVNERKLPPLDARAGYGLRPPPDEHLLIQPNWRIAIEDESGGTGSGGAQ